MRTGYGHSLLAADNPEILVSFAEFLKQTEIERLTLAVEPMPPYVLSVLLSSGPIEPMP